LSNLPEGEQAWPNVGEAPDKPDDESVPSAEQLNAAYRRGWNDALRAEQRPTDIPAADPPGLGDVVSPEDQAMASPPVGSTNEAGGVI